jgi:hypothetical protein
MVAQAEIGVVGRVTAGTAERGGAGDGRGVVVVIVGRWARGPMSPQKSFVTARIPTTRRRTPTMR